MFLSRLHHGINLFYYYIKIIHQNTLCINKQHVFPISDVICVCLCVCVCVCIRSFTKTFLLTNIYIYKVYKYIKKAYI